MRKANWQCLTRGMSGQFISPRQYVLRALRYVLRSPYKFAHVLTFCLFGLGSVLSGLKPCASWRGGARWRAQKQRCAKPMDVVLKFKILVCSNCTTSPMIGSSIKSGIDSPSCACLVLQLEDRAPDAKTVWFQRQACRIISRADQSAGFDGEAVCPLS